MGRIGSPRADDIDQIFLRDSLIRGGMDPVQAEREAAMTVLREKQARARESMPRTADGRPALGEQEAAFDSDMAMAMGQVAYGNGADIDNLAAAATPVVMDAGLGVPQSERVFQDDPTRGLAGILAAREAEAARNWEERGAYYGPKGDHYALTYGSGPDTNPKLAPVQVQNRQARTASEDRIAQAEREVRIRRLADRAGVSPSAARASMDEARGGIAGPLTFEQRMAETQDLRDAAGSRRQAELAARQDAVVRRRMAQTNPLEYMNRDDVSDWNKMVAADSMLRRGYRGATPLDVDQAAETAKALQQQRMALGQGFQQPSEAQVRGANAAADAKEAEMAGETMRIAKSIVAEYADNKGWTNILSRINPLTSGVDFHDPTVFTEDERGKALAKLQARLPHLTPEEAARLLAAAAADTTQQP